MAKMLLSQRGDSGIYKPKDRRNHTFVQRRFGELLPYLRPLKENTVIHPLVMIWVSHSWSDHCELF